MGNCKCVTHQKEEQDDEEQDYTEDDLPNSRANRASSCHVPKREHATRMFNPKVIINNNCDERVLVFVSHAAVMPLSSFRMKGSLLFENESDAEVQKFIIGKNGLKEINLDSKRYHVTAFIEQKGIWMNLWENRKFDISADVHFQQKHLNETIAWSRNNEEEKEPINIEPIRQQSNKVALLRNDEPEQVMDIGTFFSRLGDEYEEYVHEFKLNKYNTVNDLKTLTKSELQELGVTALKHRSNILAAIKSHKQASSGYNELLQKRVQLVDDCLVLFVGISTYKDNETYCNLEDVDTDRKCFEDTFADRFGYKFISNDYDSREYSKYDAVKWIQTIRDTILITNGSINFNGLILCAAAHGSEHAIICSDGERLPIKEIRAQFAAAVNSQFRNLPKVFVVNCCRTKYEKARGTQQDSDGASYSVTITGSEGDPVFGPKLSEYITCAFRNSCEKKEQDKKPQELRDVLSEANDIAENDKSGLKLRWQEYDPKVGRVVFVNKLAARGGPTARYNHDIRQIGTQKN